MLGRTSAVALVGLAGHVVDVESHLAPSLPAFTLVGLPDASLAEARDRVRAAVTSSGLAWPNRRITVNLSPATLPKTGSSFDLAVAIATLAGAGLVDAASVAGWVHLGELGLDGRLRPVRGVLPAVAAAVAAGRPRVVVPRGNAAEAELVPGARVRAADSLAQVAAHHGADVEVPEVEAVPDVLAALADRDEPDLVDVLGQQEARFGLEVAAAGHHHLLMVGPPGAGKTMLAARLPGLLPDLDEDDAVEVTAVHSVAGTFDPGRGLVRRPPYEDPHHTATPASIVGGGSGMPRPGAASRAHRGVLFLDEAPEFTSAVLQTLRQPLEHGELVLHRSAGTARYPARFQLVLAANPCPCGHAVGKGLACTCRPEQRRRYFGKLSGPLLDRVDLQLEVPAARSLDAPGEATAVVARRVRAARAAQRARWAGTSWRCNGDVPGRELQARLGADRRLVADLDRAVDRGTLSLRGADRVLRVAWTVADLAGRDAPGRSDVAQALLLRTRGHGA
ncbi:MAG: YifB family Mg chelatase-like AAA ATPase [Cellulomonas iranensis]|uniref:YifB family Mg chelatase-like AAA ATPase n=1 Tax=Cellulomonas iranensis TaxID=76862 RepID=UPI001B2B26CC|nr:YifB family Mg chelatase-like AAA ATPase [Cellulomonas iranensis]MBO9569526.1 YifB family Mg chelatase-like AAA ATPase [Cellulomonas iranensis]